MAFNSVLDKVGDRMLTPPDAFVHDLGELILANAKVHAGKTYAVDGLIGGYKDEYKEWMKAQGIFHLLAEIGDGSKHRLRFFIQRV